MTDPVRPVRIQRKKRNEISTGMGFGCYGTPLGLDYTFRLYFEVLREGKRKRYCRTCVRLATEDFKQQMIAALKKMGLS
jgi:hypothetical protein